MRPGPKKPGESAADYNARIKAMEQKFLDRPRGPKTGGGAPSTPRATSPVPPKPRSPVKPPVPVTTPKPIKPPVPVTTPKPIKTPIRDGRGAGAAAGGGVMPVRGPRDGRGSAGIRKR
jgi:hypothetical protein